MSFDVAADAYDRFMGKYSRLLSPQLADFAGVRSGQRVLDVGCGPGALTAELVARVGASGVAAVDPSEPFVAAARERNPGVEVRQASAGQLPFKGVGPAGSYLASLSADRQVELREACRTTLPTTPFVVTARAWAARGLA
jgi:ubiquinone/menaquinone biosynthesis C-methylase UbiE